MTHYDGSRASGPEARSALAPSAGTSITSGPSTRPEAHAKNAVVVSTGQLDWSRPATWTGAIDRSPCGTGTSAKMAVLHAKGQLAIGQDFGDDAALVGFAVNSRRRERGQARWSVFLKFC